MQLSVRRASRTIQDGVRSQLWPLPALAVLLAVVLGVAVPLLDVHVDQRLPPGLDAVVFNGDPGAARTVLDAISSSLITVTSLTFSLTVVTLQLASSQFSPRLLRTFTQDLFVQVTLGIFLATFTFSLTALRSVRSASEGGTVFVPRIAVTVAFLLALTSVVALVLFLAHLTRQIRVETMLQRVRDDCARTSAANLTAAGPDEHRVEVPARPPGAHVLWSRSSGFLVSVDTDRLVRAAREDSAVVALDREPGSFVARGTPLGHVWPDGAGSVDDDARERLADAAAAAVRLGPERTAAQDVAFGVRQMVDIVNKALSPGVNDPTTAVHGLGQLGAALVDLAGYALGPRALADDDGEPRLVLTEPGFDELLALAVDQPRAYGSSDAQVLAALYGLLGDVAWHVHDDRRRDAVRDQLRRLDDAVEHQGLDRTTTARLAQQGRSVAEVLDATG